MNFNEFVSEVKDNIRLFLPKDYENAEVSTMECQKLNRAYTGLMVRKEGEMLTPTINLNQLYEAYKADTLRISFSLYPADSISSHFLISDRLLDGQFFLPAFLFLLFFFLFLFSVYFFVSGICDSFLIFLFSQPFFLLSVFLHPETV